MYIFRLTCLGTSGWFSWCRHLGVSLVNSVVFGTALKFNSVNSVVVLGAGARLAVVGGLARRWVAVAVGRS